MTFSNFVLEITILISNVLSKHICIINSVLYKESLAIYRKKLLRISVQSVIYEHFIYLFSSK